MSHRSRCFERSRVLSPMNVHPRLSHDGDGTAPDVDDRAWKIKISICLKHSPAIYENEYGTTPTNDRTPTHHVHLVHSILLLLDSYFRLRIVQNPVLPTYSTNPSSSVHLYSTVLQYNPVLLQYNSSLKTAASISQTTNYERVVMWCDVM